MTSGENDWKILYYQKFERVYQWNEVNKWKSSTNFTTCIP